MASEKGFQGGPALVLGVVRTWEGKHGAPRKYGPSGPTPSRAARTKKDLVTPF